MSSESLILVVDDEDIGRAAMESVLAKEGYRVEFAVDGATALQKAEELRPDLILLDVAMPGMDGFEVVRRLRANSRMAEVPIVLVTAMDDRENKLVGLQAGADDFIAKPYDRTELRARIRTITRLNRFRRIQEERDRFQTLFEGSPIGLLMSTPEGTVLAANPMAKDLLGRVNGERITHSLQDFVRPEDRERLLTLLKRTSNGIATHAEEEFQVSTGNGEKIWVGFHNNSSDTSGDGDIQISMTNLTTRKQLEEQFRRAQKMEAIGQLAGGVAHDFNNLLTVINGYAELLLMKLPKEDPMRPSVLAIGQAGDHAASLTRQLLAFSRRSVLDPQVLDPNALVRDTEKMLRRLIGEDIRLVILLDPSLSRIRVDPGHLIQVLMNLAVNSRDAMPKGGQLTIETGNVVRQAPSKSNPALPGDGRCVCLSIADTGCGMPEEVLSRIWEPFFTTKGEGKGTGLGLAVVQGVVKQSGGFLEVRSKVGVGTTFEIYLPAVDEDLPTHEILPSPGRMRGKETVLLVEDEVVVRALAQFALKNNGYDVLPASDGKAALELVEKHPGAIDLLVTDVIMPEMGGRELVEALHHKLPHLKVLYMSGYTDDMVLRQGLIQEEVSFLQKPFSPTTLVRKVRQVLDG